MDEVDTKHSTSQNYGFHQTSSDSNGEDYIGKNDYQPFTANRRICIVGALENDTDVIDAAHSFGVPVTASENGAEYLEDHSCITIFILAVFDDTLYKMLYEPPRSILGPVALKQLARKNVNLPINTRPLYNLAMTGVVVCFTGFRDKDNLKRIVPLIHHMGGSIRKEMSSKVTHLIANVSGGDKYQYAVTFKLPIVHQSWVFVSWEHKDDVEFNATFDAFLAEHRLKPFHGTKVCFMGFPQEEEKHMVEVLQANGGCITNVDDATCSHVVVDQAEAYFLESSSAPLSPKTACDGVTSASCNNLLMSSKPSTPLLQDLRLTPAKTPVSRPLLNSTFLDTVLEKSDDNNLNHNESLSQTLIDLDRTSSSAKRKRNIAMTPDGSFCNTKRLRDLSYSENTRHKISNLFRTPIEYLSKRRRTIGGPAGKQNLHNSVISSSGIFNVKIVENLSYCGKLDSTLNSTIHSHGKNIKKNLFTRAFKSGKFRKNSRKCKQTNLDSSQMSELDRNKTLNVSCFPDISYISNPELPQARHRVETRGSCLSQTLVVDETSVAERPETLSKAQIVKAEWFWTSVQKQTCLDEKEYLYDDYIEQVLSPSNARRESHQATPSSATRRKRKRLQETLSSLALQPSPSIHKRRSSVSDAGLLSMSGSFLDCTSTPDKTLGDLPEGSPAIEAPRKVLSARHQVFLELVQTESNYVNILETIMTMFKKHLEEMSEEEALLNNTELKIIFGNLPLIYETHVKMLDQLLWTSAHWTEERSIGNILLKFSPDLLKAYPPFVNFFEEMKDMLLYCDVSKPRFHAFLKACQTRPECGRQTLQDLLIRPVQRLPSISLLLNDIVKNTSKSNSDHGALCQALSALKEVMTLINEDKRKTEGQRVMFDIFNDIDNCPPDLVSSHRNFVTRCEVVQLSSSEGLSGKGHMLVLFLFTDQLEVCKKRSKAFNSLKSPNTVNGFHQKSSSKPYKHVKLMSLNCIKRVIDIKETDDCQKVLSIVFRNNDDIKERLFSFAMTDDEADKTEFLRTLTKQMATHACTADADKFLAYLEPQQLDIDTSDLSNGTFSKAFKFANRTRLKVGRAFSFNKTPSKLKRAVSSMMSPFGSSTNITPASQLAQMRLASYSNINELGGANNTTDPTPVAPMSVQPTRKLKASSLGAAALKRL